MRLTTTKKLANELNKKFDKQKDFFVYSSKMTAQQYQQFVDSTASWFNCFDSCDYDYATNSYRVLVIEYPAGYYACNQYVTTKDLTNIFKNLKNKTWDCFCEAFHDAFAI